MTEKSSDEGLRESTPGWVRVALFVGAALGAALVYIGLANLASGFYSYSAPVNPVAGRGQLLMGWVLLTATSVYLLVHGHRWAAGVVFADVAFSALMRLAAPHTLWLVHIYGGLLGFPWVP